MLTMTRWRHGYVVLVVACLLLASCKRDEIPDVSPDDVALTLSATSINADDGSISADALVTQQGVVLEGINLQFILTDSAGTDVTKNATTDADGLASTTFNDIRLAGPAQIEARFSVPINDVQTFDVEPGIPTSVTLEITGPLDDMDQQLPVVAGEDLQFSVTLHDDWDNVTTGQVEVTTTAPGATVGAASLTDLTVAGDYEVTAALVPDGAINDTQPYGVIPADAFEASINLTATTVEAGDQLAFECYVLDAFGNVRTDTFAANDVSTTATTFGGGAPDVTLVQDLPGGGTSFTLGGAGGPLNVLDPAFDLTCEGAGFGGAVTDGTDSFAVVDTTAPQNVTIAMVSPTVPVRPDNALAPSEMATIQVTADDIVAIDNITLNVMGGDPALPTTQTTTLMNPQPGMRMADLDITVQGTADTFDQVRVVAIVEDTSGNQTMSGTLRHPIDLVADDTPVATGFFVRTWARSTDFNTATGLTLDTANDTAYYLAPGTNGTDLFEVAAAGDTNGTLIASDMGGAGSAHTRGVSFSADFSGVQDIFFSRAGGGTDRTVHGVDVGAGNDATFSADPDGDADNTPLDNVVLGNSLYYLLQNTGMTPFVELRVVDNMGGGMLFSDLTMEVTTPRGITFDSADNLYVADNSDGTVTQIDDMGAAADVGVTLDPVTVDAAATITTNGGDFDDQLLITNEGGQLHKVDVAGQATLDVCGDNANAFFTSPIDIVFDANFTTDIDGDGADDMNVPTALILDPTDGIIYRVHGF